MQMRAMCSPAAGEARSHRVVWSGGSTRRLGQYRTDFWNAVWNAESRWGGVCTFLGGELGLDLEASFFLLLLWLGPAGLSPAGFFTWE